MNLKTLIPLSFFILEACGASPPPSAGPEITDASQSASPDLPDPDWDATLRALDETNRMLEDCIMPAYGLYMKTLTCDLPPNECKEGDQ